MHTEIIWWWPNVKNITKKASRNLELTRCRKFPCCVISFLCWILNFDPHLSIFISSKYSSTHESLLLCLILLIWIRLLMWVKLYINIRLCRLRIFLSKPCPLSLSPQPMNSSGAHSYTNKQSRGPRDINWPEARARMSFFQSEVLKSALLVLFLVMVLHSVKFLPGLPKCWLHFIASMRSYDKCKIVGLSVMKCFIIHSQEKCSWILVKNDTEVLNFVLNQSACRSRRAGFIMLKKEILWNILKSRCKGSIYLFIYLFYYYYYQVCQNTSKVMEPIK